MKRALALLLLASCAPIAEFQTTPFVEPSVDAPARWQIFINRVRDGVYRAYAPRCIDTVQLGHVVEFMNFNPEIPANVSSISGPAPLYSPNLRRPYNYVGPEDPANTLCEVEVNGACAERPAWSYWRHRFDVPGVYDWFDSNQGAPGRKVVDPYYGTETFIGLDPSTPLGTICVPAADGSGCESVCCTHDSDCLGGTRCFRGELDSRGRCRTPAS